jgi:hypothetical protein
LERFDGVFGCESSHHECQLAVGGRLDGSPVNPLHELRCERAASVQFHNKLSIFHGLSLPLSYTGKPNTAQYQAGISIPAVQSAVWFGLAAVVRDTGYHLSMSRLHPECHDSDFLVLLMRQEPEEEEEEDEGNRKEEDDDDDEEENDDGYSE